METDEQVSQAVRVESARGRLTQAAVADRLGMTRSALNARLNGHTHWSAGEVVKLSEALDLPVCVLLTGTEQ